MIDRDLLANATPRPWEDTGQTHGYGAIVSNDPAELQRERERSGRGDDHIRAYGGVLVAESVQKADRAFIVRAANEYEALLDIEEAAELLAGQSFGQLSSRDFYALRESFARLDAIRSGT